MVEMQDFLDDLIIVIDLLNLCSHYDFKVADGRL